MTLRPLPRETRADCEARRARLLRRYARHRNPADLEQLVVSYRPLARSLARRYSAVAAGPEDLEQVAYEGLIKAIHRFDPEYGSAFASFAVPTILGELRRYLRDTAWPAHVPRPLQERVREVRTTAVAFATRRGRIPTARELAETLEREVEEVVEALDVTTSLSIASLDAMTGRTQDGERHPVERLGSEDPGYEHVEYLAAIEQLLPALTRHQRQALRLHFDEDLGYRQIAHRLGVSRAQAARELDAAVTTLRDLQHAA
jgi:RNA polymerase sigma-B factor